MTEPADVFRACYAAYLADDWDSLGQLLTDDVVLESPGSPPAVGREAVLAQHRQTKLALPDIGGEYSEIATLGDVVGGRKVILGTNTGTINAGGRELPPTGRRIQLPESDWMRMANGRCAHHWIYMTGCFFSSSLACFPGSRRHRPDRAIPSYLSETDWSFTQASAPIGSAEDLHLLEPWCRPGKRRQVTEFVLWSMRS